MIEYRKLITRKMVRAEAGTLFVFGDNMVRQGYGGQARAMRGEPNAVGIVTKLTPSMTENAFFNDSEDNLMAWKFVNNEAFQRLLSHRGRIIWPADGIGTGRAQLQRRAPRIWHELLVFQRRLERA